jgi:hypothetical protein
MQSQQIGVSRGNHSLFDGAKKKRKMRNEFEKSLYLGPKTLSNTVVTAAYNATVLK